MFLKIILDSRNIVLLTGAVKYTNCISAEG